MIMPKLVDKVQDIAHHLQLLHQIINCPFQLVEGPEVYKSPDYINLRKM